MWTNKGSRRSNVMCLMRTLFYIVASGNFHVSVTHIPGVKNSLGDARSRLLFKKFRRLVPEADLDPTLTLKIGALEKTCGEIMAAAIAPSTHRIYHTAQQQYTKFCQLVAFDPYPASQHTLAYFVAQLVRNGKSHRTIRVYLAGIYSYYTQHSLPLPACRQEELQLLLRGALHMGKQRSNVKWGSDKRISICLIIIGCPEGVNSFICHLDGINCATLMFVWAV